MIAFPDFTRRAEISDLAQMRVDFVYIWLASGHRSREEKIEFLLQFEDWPLADLERASIVLDGDYSLVSESVCDLVARGDHLKPVDESG